MRVLLVAQDEILIQNMRGALRRAEISLETAEDGQDGIELARHYDYDVVVLDGVLPDMKGTEAIRRLRKAGIQTPVLALTQQAAECKVEALNAGADDCMARPFHPDELIGRVRALVRRSRGYANPAITIGGITLDLSSKTVEACGKRVQLTEMEYQIFELLLLRKGVTVSRETFISHLYGDEDGPESRTIELFVCKLRKKLADATGGEQFIETIRQQGYLLHHTAAKAAA